MQINQYTDILKYIYQTDEPNMHINSPTY